MPPSSARRVHGDLIAALERCRRAEHSAVTLFARVVREEMYRPLGYATVELYGTRGLGLSSAKTRQFLRLARSLDRLPATSEALDVGRLDWTKARTIAAVATPRTERRWVAEAARSTSRELEARVRDARARNRRERDRQRRNRGQAALVLAAPAAPAPGPQEMPVTVSLSLTPVQHARYEALLERLRRKGDRRSRAAVVLDGLAALAAADGPREPSAPPFQIVAYRCGTCNTTTVNRRPIARAAAAAMACDAVHVSHDRTVPNRATIPPSVRRAVLVRDGHRCTTPGCGAMHFLEVHHSTPRSAGGTNQPANLKTLCGACHRFTHARE